MAELKARMEAIRLSKETQRMVVGGEVRDEAPKETKKNSAQMPEVRPMEHRKPPSVAGSLAGSNRSGKSLQEYMAERRGIRSKEQGPAGSSVSDRTTDSVAQLRDELVLNRQEMANLRSETKDIKALLQKLIAQRN